MGLRWGFQARLLLGLHRAFTKGLCLKQFLVFMGRSRASFSGFMFECMGFSLCFGLRNGRNSRGAQALFGGSRASGLPVAAGFRAERV